MKILESEQTNTNINDFVCKFYFTVYLVNIVPSKTYTVYFMLNILRTDLSDYLLIVNQGLKNNLFPWVTDMLPSKN